MLPRGGVGELSPRFKSESLVSVVQNSATFTSLVGLRKQGPHLAHTGGEFRQGFPECTKQNNDVWENGGPAGARCQASRPSSPS